MTPASDAVCPSLVAANALAEWSPQLQAPRKELGQGQPCCCGTRVSSGMPNAAVPVSGTLAIRNKAQHSIAAALFASGLAEQLRSSMGLHRECL
eukprot:CAMPEP_0115242020 /NCGR_PEP_ID=MMETSP0270-20121206/38731_1 /TAXON_ID=71861 /ORGANISM="Scrippsiella trochoidea, Strain CCMP3099" /LENGTH=93 /DNA_ID=CAMNT_0002657061 /DNA_START=481 /DNA_END=760 /DNA_ORIENTATION=+